MGLTGARASRMAPGSNYGCCVIDTDKFVLVLPVGPAQAKNNLNFMINRLLMFIGIARSRASRTADFIQFGRVALSCIQATSRLFGEGTFNGISRPRVRTGMVRASTHFLISE